MALNHAENSKSYNSIAYATYSPRNDSNSPGNHKEPPLLKATYYLVECFKGIAKKSNDES